MTGMQQRGKKVISVAKMLRWMPKDGSAESSTGKRKEKKNNQKKQRKESKLPEKKPQISSCETWDVCCMQTAHSSWHVQHYQESSLSL